MASKGKGSKNVDVISALKAFETTLRASSRHRGVPVHRPLLEQLQQCQESSKPLLTVVLAGTGVSGDQVAAVAECLAYYPAVKSVSCLGCSVGSKGLAAIASLLQASGSRWWHGCRLQSLEVCSDSSKQLLCPAPQQDAAAAATAATSTSQQSSRAHPAIPHSSMQHLLDNRPASAPPASTSLQQSHVLSPCRPLTGICPPVPGYLQLPGQLVGPGSPHTQDDMRLPVGCLRQVRYKIQAPRTKMEVTAWALAPTLGTIKHKHTSAKGNTERHLESAAKTCCFSAGAMQQLSLALGVTGLQLQRLVLDHTTLGDDGISSLAAGLRCCSSLKVLSLQHCGIGAAGAKELAEAVTVMPSVYKKQSSGTNSSSTPSAHGMGSRMSMGSVGLSVAPPAVSAESGGPSTTSTAVSSSMTSSGKSSSASEPVLLELHMSGNPLGPAGLHAISKAVKIMPDLKVLGLADIGVDAAAAAGQLEVQVLAHSLLSSPNELTTLDFADNIISDECALYFVGLLKAKASVTLLKLTPRLSPNIMQQVTALLEEHHRMAKSLRVSKKTKKPA